MNDFVFKVNCTVDSQDYMTVEAGRLSTYPSMYFTAIRPDKADGIEDEEVCVALNRKQVKKMRKFLKEWLDETRSVD